MANRCTLHKTKLEDFKSFLDSEGIAYREGKGSYQALQVQTDKGWQTVYERNDMPEHFTVQDKLMPLVREFLDESKQDIEKVLKSIAEKDPKLYMSFVTVDMLKKYT